MRLCFLTEVFCPPTFEGTAIHSSQLARELTAAGDDVLVLTRKWKEDSLSHESVGGVRIMRIPPAGQFRGKGWRAIPPMFLFLSRIMTQLALHSKEYDLIVVFGAKVLTIPAILMKIFGGKKCIVRVESPQELREGVTRESLHTMKLSRSSSLLRLILRLQTGFLQRADRVVALSGEILEALLGLDMKPDKIAAISNGIDVADFKPAEKQEKRALRRKLSLPPGKALVVYTGRIARSKGLTTLAVAWQKLAAEHPDIHLVLVGGSAGAHDSCEEELRSFFQRQGAAETVTFTGSVTNVPEYLQAADLFVFPSEWEAFSLSIVEAMACALPVVATRVGGANDCIRHGENGFLVNPGDEKGLFGEMDRLLRNRQSWLPVGHRARKKVLDDFSLRKEVTRYTDLFSQLLEPRSSRKRISEKSIRNFCWLLPVVWDVFAG